MLGFLDWAVLPLIGGLVQKVSPIRFALGAGATLVGGLMASGIVSSIGLTLRLNQQVVNNGQRTAHLVHRLHRERMREHQKEFP